jgi:hypothetical protein
MPMFSTRRRSDEGGGVARGRDGAERRRREVLCADFDRIPNDRCPWTGGAASARREALHEAVRAAVASALTEKQRRLVEGYFFEGLSQGDLARELGITQQVVQKTLFGAVRGGKRVGGALCRLRAALAPHVGAAGAAHGRIEGDARAS